MEIIRWCEARDKGLSFYFNGKPCKRGHISKRHVSGGWCYECHKEDCRGRWKQAKRPDYFRQFSAKVRAIKTNTIPAWAEWDKIEAIYAECAQLAKETGINYHVDHIIPQNGENVSGLHVHTNLRIITATENMKKRNKVFDDLIEQTQHYN